MYFYYHAFFYRICFLAFWVLALLLMALVKSVPSPLLWVIFKLLKQKNKLKQISFIFKDMQQFFQIQLRLIIFLFLLYFDINVSLFHSKLVY